MGSQNTPLCLTAARFRAAIRQHEFTSFCHPDSHNTVTSRKTAVSLASSRLTAPAEEFLSVNSCHSPGTHAREQQFTRKIVPLHSPYSCSWSKIHDAKSIVVPRYFTASLSRDAAVEEYPEKKIPSPSFPSLKSVTRAASRISFRYLY